jgi:hypothetical protein
MFKDFSFVTDCSYIRLNWLITGKPFHPDLIFADKAVSEREALNID